MDRRPNPQGLLLLKTGDEKREIEFEMAFLLSLTVRQRFVLMERLLQSLKENRADFDEADFLTHNVLIRQHLLKTDIHPFVKGVAFEEVWKNKISGKIGKAEVFFPRPSERRGTEARLLDLVSMNSSR